MTVVWCLLSVGGGGGGGGRDYVREVVCVWCTHVNTARARIRHRPIHAHLIVEVRPFATFSSNVCKISAFLKHFEQFL